MCVDRTHLYRNLRKGPTKEEKGPFLNKEQIRTRLKKGITIHRRELAVPPEYDCRTGDYPMRELFIKAEKVYLESHNQIHSWSKVLRSSVARDIKILDYKWVYVYKFDKHGRFEKCKVYLIIRGD